MFSIYLSICFITLVNSQMPEFGVCPPITPMQNFSVTGFLGRWYESEKVFTLKGLGKCITNTFNLTDSGMVTSENYQIDLIMNQPVRRIAKVTFSDAPLQARLVLVYADDPLAIQFPQHVLKTDYANYLVIYACKDFFLFHINYIWIYTRVKVPSDKTLQDAREVLKFNRLEHVNLIKTDQLNCDN